MNSGRLPSNGSVAKTCRKPPLAIAPHDRDGDLHPVRSRIDDETAGDAPLHVGMIDGPLARLPEQFHASTGRVT